MFISRDKSTLVLVSHYRIFPSEKCPQSTIYR